jgi:hypothetical protein
LHPRDTFKKQWLAKNKKENINLYNFFVKNVLSKYNLFNQFFLLKSNYLEVTRVLKRSFINNEFYIFSNFWNFYRFYKKEMSYLAETERISYLSEHTVDDDVY